MLVEMSAGTPEIEIIKGLPEDVEVLNADSATILLTEKGVKTIKQALETKTKAERKAAEAAKKKKELDSAKKEANKFRADQPEKSTANEKLRKLAEELQLLEAERKGAQEQLDREEQTAYEEIKKYNAKAAIKDPSDRQKASIPATQVETIELSEDDGEAKEAIARIKEKRRPKRKRRRSGDGQKGDGRGSRCGDKLEARDREERKARSQPQAAERGACGKRKSQE